MYIRELTERKKELTKLINRLEREVAGLPGGNLRVNLNHKTPSYYLVTSPENPKGEYIKEQDFAIAQKLAHKSYCEKLLKECKREEKAINYYLKNMSGIAPEEVYEHMNEYRKALVSPILLSNKEFGENWVKKEYQGNSFHPEELEYQTERGEMVRTKSELLIANMYYEMGVPYRYEYPVKLYNGHVKYPDFTLLKFPERKMIYHEHMGLLDEEDYRRNNLTKIRDYSQSGIILGKNLIVTFETEYIPLNIKALRKMVKEVLEL